MSVAVIIPWRSEDPTRLRGRDFVVRRYRHLFPTWQLILAELPSGAWSKGTAVALGRDRTDADVLVIADADCLVEENSLRIAQRAVEAGNSRWAMPHTFVHRLNEDATERVLAAGQLPGPYARLERAGYHGVPGGGITVVAADAYDDCPIDARFLDWGCEDTAFGMALTCLHGDPHQGLGILWHLWHTPMHVDHQSPPESAPIMDAYKAAQRFPRHMRHVVRGEPIPDAEPVTPVQFRSQTRRALKIGPTVVRLDAKGIVTLTDPDMIEVMRHQPGVDEVQA